MTEFIPIPQTEIPHTATSSGENKLVSARKRKRARTDRPRDNFDDVPNVASENTHKQDFFSQLKTSLGLDSIHHEADQLPSFTPDIFEPALPFSEDKPFARPDVSTTADAMIEQLDVLTVEERESFFMEVAKRFRDTGHRVTSLIERSSPVEEPQSSEMNLDDLVKQQELHPGIDVVSHNDTHALQSRRTHSENKTRYMSSADINSDSIRLPQGTENNNSAQHQHDSVNIESRRQPSHRQEQSRLFWRGALTGGLIAGLWGRHKRMKMERRFNKRIKAQERAISDLKKDIKISDTPSIQSKDIFDTQKPHATFTRKRELPLADYHIPHKEMVKPQVQDKATYNYALRKNKARSVEKKNLREVTHYIEATGAREVLRVESIDRMSYSTVETKNGESQAGDKAGIPAVSTSLHKYPPHLHSRKVREILVATKNELRTLQKDTHTKVLRTQSSAWVAYATILGLISLLIISTL